MAARKEGDATCCRCGILISRGKFCEFCREPVKASKRKRLLGELRGMPLSFRERQLVERVALGETNKEIADELLLSEGTIKLYMSTIFKKTGIRSRTKLCAAKLRGNV